MIYLKKFNVEAFLAGLKDHSTDISNRHFYEVCDLVKSAIDLNWNKASTEAQEVFVGKEKAALMGVEKDVLYFKDTIGKILAERKLLSEPFPSYYKSLTDAVFSELYGYAGITPWIYNETEAYKNSSSAKLIGDKLYCLIDGQTQLQPQRISRQRREQLRSNLILGKQRDDDINEVYLENGTRVTMFSEKKCKPGQDVIVFRKYLLQSLTLDTLASYGTFPKEAVVLFEAMIGCGFNTIFVGEMRSGKTTFMQTWVKNYEKLEPLEGVAIATDTETDWNRLVPEVPIVQLVADGKDLDKLSKPIRRTDADFVILEEMRDAVAYKMFTDIISLGTMHSAGTIHDRVSVNVPKKMADAIASEYGGNRDSIIAQLYKNVNYCIELYQVPEDKSKKRLKGIVELRYDSVADTISAHRICQYDAACDKWYWKYDVGKDKEDLCIGRNKYLDQFEETLLMLEEQSPLTGDTVEYPAYYEGNEKIKRDTNV